MSALASHGLMAPQTLGVLEEGAPFSKGKEAECETHTPPPGPMCRDASTYLEVTQGDSGTWSLAPRACTEAQTGPPASGRWEVPGPRHPVEAAAAVSLRAGTADLARAGRRKARAAARSAMARRWFRALARLLAGPPRRNE